MSDTGDLPTDGRQHTEQVMGTAVSIDVRDADVGPGAIDEVVQWLHHVDETFSTYRNDSPISAIGRAEVTLDRLTDEIREVLRRCERLRRETGGAFDAFAVPAPNGTRFDPSGFVKGWSIELAATILEAHGARNFLINAGGDIALRGQPAPGRAWQIGIRHPSQADALALSIHAAGRLAVATSGLYERSAHIVDPRSGRPPTELTSATVVGPDLAEADGYATAVFVLGVAGLDLIATQVGYDAYIITVDAMTMWTDGFERYRQRP